MTFTHVAMKRALLKGAAWSAFVILSSQEGLAQNQETDVSAENQASDEIIVTGRRLLEDTTQESTKLSRSLEETPQSITVLDEEVFDALGIANNAEAVAYVPGVTFSGNFGSVYRFTARGYSVTGDNSIKVNGLGMGLDKPLDNIAVQRVEFIKGGSGTTFGEGGPGGFVNVITRKPSEELEVRFRGEAGSFDHWRVEGSVSGPLAEAGNTRFLLAGSLDRSDSYVRFQRYSAKTVYAALTMEPSDGIDLEINGYYNYQKRPGYNDGWPLIVTADGAGDVTGVRFPSLLPIDTNTGQPWSLDDVKFWFIHARADFKLADWAKLSVVGGYTSVYTSQTLFDLCCSVTPDYMTEGYGYKSAHSSGTPNVEARLNGDFSAGGAKITYLLTGEYRNRDKRDRYADNPLLGPVDLLALQYDVPNPFEGQTRDQWITYAVHSSGNIYSGSGTIVVDYGPLSVTGGARYDKFKPIVASFADNYRTPLRTDAFASDNWSFRGAAMYEVIEGGRFYYSYGETFEINRALTCDGSALPPTTGRIHEIGYKQLLFNDGLLFTANAYHVDTKGNPVREAPDACPLPDSTVRAGKGTTNKGFEIELVGRVNRNFNILGGLSHVDAVRHNDDGTGDTRAVAAAPWQGSLFMIYDFLDGPLKGAGVSFGATYQSRHVATDTPFGGGLEDRYYLDAQFRGKVAFYYRLNDGVNFSLHINNIFDAKHESVPYATTSWQNQWREPRNLLFTVDVEL